MSAEAGTSRTSVSDNPESSNCLRSAPEMLRRAAVDYVDPHSTVAPMPDADGLRDWLARSDRRLFRIALSTSLST